MNLQRVRALPSVMGSDDHPRSTRVSRRLPPPASRASGNRSKERPQADLAFRARQRRAKAEVPAAGERQVLARVVAFDVEAVRVGEDFGSRLAPAM